MKIQADALAFDFDSNLERTVGAVKGEDRARYTAGARVPTADTAMDMPSDLPTFLRLPSCHTLPIRPQTFPKTKSRSYARKQTNTQNRIAQHALILEYKIRQ